MQAHKGGHSGAEVSGEKFAQGLVRRIRRKWKCSGGVRLLEAEVLGGAEERAIEHYVNHGRCFAFTRRVLGYPSRQKLTEWVGERYPETMKCVVRNVGKPAASLASKRAAVYELCTRKGSAREVASKLDVTQLFAWCRFTSESSDMPIPEFANHTSRQESFIGLILYSCPV